MQDEEERRPRPASEAARVTVDDAADSLRRKLAVEGARKSYRENCATMQRVHLGPRLGAMPIGKLATAHVEDLAERMLKKGLAPKTVRNVIAFLHSVCEHAIDRGWIAMNPVTRAARPKRRRAGDAQPDLQFLTLPELEAVLRAIPDEVVVRSPAPTRPCGWRRCGAGRGSGWA
jgi:site-specific recombinase XerD